jgi:hypothetical protein
MMNMRDLRNVKYTHDESFNITSTNVWMLLHSLEERSDEAGEIIKDCERRIDEELFKMPFTKRPCKSASTRYVLYNNMISAIKSGAYVNLSG